MPLRLELRRNGERYEIPEDFEEIGTRYEKLYGAVGGKERVLAIEGKDGLWYTEDGRGWKDFDVLEYAGPG